MIPRSKAVPTIKSGTERQLAVLIEQHSFQLSTVEQVTVAADYAQFVLDFDTGFRPREAISATEGDNKGVGITPEVLRNGVLGSHIIFSQDIAFPLAYTAGQDLHLHAVYALTHEAAHAEEHLIAFTDYRPQIISLHMQPDFYLVLGRT